MTALDIDFRVSLKHLASHRRQYHNSISYKTGPNSSPGVQLVISLVGLLSRADTHTTERRILDAHTNCVTRRLGAPCLCVVTDTVVT